MDKIVVARTRDGAPLLLNGWQLKRGRLTPEGVEMWAHVEGKKKLVTVEFKGELMEAIRHLNITTISKDDGESLESGTSSTSTSSQTEPKILMDDTAQTETQILMDGTTQTEPEFLANVMTPTEPHLSLENEPHPTPTYDDLHKDIRSNIVEVVSTENVQEASTHDDDEDALRHFFVPSEDEEREAVRAPLKRPPHCCVFCQKLITHVAKHFAQKHAEDIRVKEYLNSSTIQEKTQKMKDLIKEGDSLYNILHPSSPIPIRRAAKQLQRARCLHCGIFISVKHMPEHLRRHHPGQPFLHTGMTHVHHPQPVPVAADIEMEATVRTFVDNMRIQERRRLISADRYVILHANSVFRNAFTEKKLIAARSTITIVLRVLVEMKRVNQFLKTSVDCVKNTAFVTFISAISNLCGRVGTEFKRASVVNMYGQAFKKFAKAVESFLIFDDLIEEATQVTRFLQLFNNRFAVEVGSTSKQQYELSSAVAKQRIPLMEDVVKLNDYILTVMGSAMTSLSTKFTISAYSLLVKSLFMRWWVFNRRRVAEIEYLTIDHWEKAVDLDPQSEAYKLLSPTEKVMSSSFKRLSICGKRSKLVSLLVHISDLRAIDMMINLRTNAQIPASNRFLFTTGVGRVSGSGIMREFAQNCGATSPELLRGTILRRHAAVCAQYLNLGSEDLRQLSQALGHNLSTHMEHYRKPEAALHLGRISILMCALNSGTITKFKNMSLDDIDLGDIDRGSGECPTEPQASPAAPSGSTTFPEDPIPSCSKDVLTSADESDEYEPPKRRTGQKKTPSAAPSGSTTFPEDPIPSCSYKDVLTPADESEEYEPPKRRQKKRKLDSDSDEGGSLERAVTRQRKSVPKRKWLTPEKKALMSSLGVSVFSPTKQMPSLSAISSVMKNFKCFKDRTPSQVHAFIHNSRKKKKNYKESSS